MNDTPTSPDTLTTEGCIDLMTRGFVLANRAVVETIESECIRVTMPTPGRWYDTRPMLDPHEHAPDVVDMATQALQYALDAGLAHRHPYEPHLVRVTEAPL